MNNPKQARSPAFQFYADDFLAGTLVMDQADVGAYIRLLCHQWSRGSIPAEAEKQQRLAGGSVSADVLAKFPAGDDGLLRNPRLEIERQKQLEFRESQRQKGLRSAEMRRSVNHGSATVGTAVQPSPQPEWQPNGQPEGNSPSPSPSPSKYISVEVEPEELSSLKERIGAWFNRRLSTPWSEKEIKALKAVIKLKTPPEDMDLLERRYRSNDPYLRREIITLLNNWNGEIDKARLDSSRHQVQKHTSTSMSGGLEIPFFATEEEKDRWYVKQAL